MYKELNVFDKDITEEQAIESIFKAIHRGFDSICLPLQYLSLIKDMIPGSIQLTCPIDYPYGLSSSKVRQHATLSAIRNGADIVNLVVNPVYIVNYKQDKLEKDLFANKTICDKNNIDFRVMLEYRQHRVEDIKKILDILKKLKITEIYPSTGHFLDEATDNIAMAKVIKSYYKKSKIITNGNMWHTDHIELAQKNKVYGISIKHIHNISIANGV